MIEKKKLTPIVLAGIFVLLLGLSYAAVPLYDLFCRVTGFGGTTQVSNNPPKIVLDKVVSVRFDTNINNLPFQVCWNKNRTFKYDNIYKKAGQLIYCLQQPKPSWKETFMSNIRTLDL